jgi:hypothetical protein
MLLTNPFHLLGLPADATAKERSERESRIRAYLQVGKPLEFGEQDVVLGAKRNAGNVQKALKAMQAADARMESGFFWFTRSGMLDEQALGLLAEDKRDECRGLLDKLEGREPTSGYFSSLMNLGTFRMLEALLVRDGAAFISGLTVKMKALGAVDEAVLLKWARSIGDEISSSDVDKVLSHFESAFESVRNEAERYGLTVSPADWTQALKAGGSRFGSMEEAMASGPRAKVMDAVSTCRTAREEGDFSASVAADAMLEMARPAMEELKTVLAADHLVVCSLGDAVAKELLECAVVHWNRAQEAGRETESTIDVSLRLVEEAMRWADGVAVLDRAEEHTATLNRMRSRFHCPGCGEAMDKKVTREVKMYSPAVSTGWRTFSYKHITLDLAMCAKCGQRDVLERVIYWLVLMVPLSIVTGGGWLVTLLVGLRFGAGFLWPIRWVEAIAGSVRRKILKQDARYIELKSQGWGFKEPTS